MSSVLLFLAAAVTAGGDGQAALQDLAQFPAEKQPYIYYISSAQLDSDDARRSADIALRLVLPSVSRQKSLEYCSPDKVLGEDTLYRMDLQGLQWNLNDWYKVLARYPYSPIGSKYSRVVRIDWLLVQLTDSQESGAYYDLLYGKRPKNRAEALAVFGVNPSVQFRIGMVAGDSGVSVSGTRTLINFPTNQRAYAWLTEDTINLDPARDPLEQAHGGAAHDGEELIIGIPKTHLASGVTGFLQGYALFNGQGATVNRAPTDLVVDHHQARRGIPEIRNGISCIVCHNRGLNFPAKNEFRDYLTSGVEVYSDYKTKEFLEQFHLADLDKEMRRSNEDFAAIVQAACGVPPSEASALFHAAVYRYDEALTFERAAFEVYMEPDEFKLAISLASAKGYKLGARVSGLAHGKTISRDSWESQYFSVRQYADYWRTTK